MPVLKFELHGFNVKMPRRPRAPRAASTFGLQHPSGSRRRSWGGHFCRGPSTGRVIFSHRLE